MKKWNGQAQTPAARLLIQGLFHEAILDSQRDTSDKESDYRRPITHHDRTLRAAIEQVSKQLEVRANALQKRCCTRVDRVHWQTRGRQALLRCMAGHLKGLCTGYDTSYALYLALKDYLGCLEKYAVDMEEEKRMPIPSSERPIQRWKAEGAARELAVVVAHLMHLLVAHMPPVEQHILSLDGNYLIPLQGDDEHKEEQGEPGNREIQEKESLLISSKAIRRDKRTTVQQGQKRRTRGLTDQLE